MSYSDFTTKKRGFRHSLGLLAHRKVFHYNYTWEVKQLLFAVLHANFCIIAPKTDIFLQLTLFLLGT